ncbi:MAG: EF-hand domain-containing protein [Gemmataceae bacterium]|nr:EF-hand domain-containing protein [Gemmataceae bacterium]
MKRFLLVLAALGFAFTCQGFGDSPKKKKKSPDAVFSKLDANNDASLSKEEFGKISEGKKKKPKNPEKMANKLFSKLDSNSDEKLSKEEFKKMAELKKKKKEQKKS